MFHGHGTCSRAIERVPWPQNNMFLGAGLAAALHWRVNLLEPKSRCCCIEVNLLNPSTVLLLHFEVNLLFGLLTCCCSVLGVNLSLQPYRKSAIDIPGYRSIDRSLARSLALAIARSLARIIPGRTVHCCCNYLSIGSILDFSILKNIAQRTSQLSNERLELEL